MSELNEFEREIEIDGVKVAVDMRTVKKIDVYRVGDNVKVLTKSCDIYRTYEPTKKENKSKKLLLLLKPTLHERLKTKAASFDMSINELVSQILEQNV